MLPETIDPVEFAHLMDLRRAVETATEVLASHLAFLARKYALGPDDLITEDGGIARAGPATTETAESTDGMENDE